jgi:hypothetical protein
VVEQGFCNCRVKQLEQQEQLTHSANTEPASSSNYSLCCRRASCLSACLLLSPACKQASWL